jgi:hypothetical protein
LFVFIGIYLGSYSEWNEFVETTFNDMQSGEYVRRINENMDDDDDDEQADGGETFDQGPVFGPLSTNSTGPEDMGDFYDFLMN